MIQIDMEMPKDCQHCKYYRLDAGYVWCTLLNAYKNDSDCPLKEVPSGKWIPVSEELPLTEDEVLVTYIVNGNRKKRYVETAYYYPITDEWNSINDEYRIPNTKVEIIAWMPLPKPYEPQESEETETWNGIHAQITAPKGTFDKIFNDTEEDIDDI